MNEKVYGKAKGVEALGNSAATSPLTTVGLKPLILQAQKSNLADQEKTCLLQADSQIHIKANSEAIHINSLEGQFT